MDAFFFQTSKHKVVDFVAVPICVLYGRKVGLDRPLKCPVVAKLRTLTHPFTQQCDLFEVEPLFRILRHDFKRIVGLNSSNQFTLIRFTRYNGADAVLMVAQGRFAKIQSKPRLAARRVRTVTGKAMVGQNRLNVTIEIDLDCLVGLPRIA